MANKYYALDTTDFSTWVTSVAEALVDKFGDGVTMVAKESNNLVFTCPAISEKAIRITSNYAYYGTVSGTTFTSQNSFFYEYDSKIRALEHLVLGDAFMLISGVGRASSMILVAKTVGGVSLTCGAVYGTSNYYQTNNRFCSHIDGVTSTAIDFVDMGRQVFCQTGVPYKLPLHMFDFSLEGDQLLRQQNGELDTIEDLWMSMYNPETKYLANGGLFSAANVYTVDNRIRLRTALLAEF